jgi:hypothetical protein
MILKSNVVHKLILFFILCILTIKIKDVFYSFDNYINFNDLFINYEGGFIKRGLLGQIAFFFYKKFSISPIIFFSFIFSLLNIIYFSLYILCIDKFKNNYYLYSILLLSPATLMFNIFDSVIFFHSQIFLIISILLHTFIAIKYFDRFYIYKKFLIFLILPILFINIFIYEPQIFTLASHILITYVVKSRNLKSSYKVFYFYIFLFFPIYFVGFKNAQTDLLVIKLMKESVRENFYFIINSHPESFKMIDTNDWGGNLNLKIGALIKIFGIYFLYINKIYLFTAIILSLFLFYLIFFYFIKKKIYLININLKILIFFLIPLLLTFIFITDFGRAINIILLHLLCFFFLFKINKKKENFFLKNISFFKKNITILFIIIYCNFWTLSHVAGWVTIFNPEIPKYSKYSSYTNELNNILFNLYFYTDKYLINLPKAEFMKPFLKI